MMQFITYLSNIRRLLSKHEHTHVILDRRLTVGSPSELTAKIEQKDNLSPSCLLLYSYLPLTRHRQLRYVVVILFVLLGCVSEVWGDIITLTYSNITETSYKNDETSFQSTVEFGYTGISRNNSNGTPTEWAASQVMQVRKSSNGAGTLYNKGAISTISNIRVYIVANTNSFTLTYGTTSECSAGSITRPQTPSGTESITYTSYDSSTKKTSSGQTTTATYYDFDLGSASPTYFKITNGGNVIYIWKIIITYSSCTQLGSINGSVSSNFSAADERLLKVSPLSVGKSVLIYRSFTCHLAVI